MIPRHVVRVVAPEVTGQEVVFGWSVTPASPLYRTTRFRMRFPDDVDLGRVPEGIWWRIALTCLHSQWALLRPCRIVLPVALEPGEAETWLRLCDAQIATLEAHAGRTDTARELELVEAGPRLRPLSPGADAGIVAACFSGGRDSLTQLALLQELGERPLLVSTTAEREGSGEHDHPHRLRVLEEVQHRRGVELVEVHSDLRSCFANDFAAERYGVSVTELTDTFLYFASAVAVAVARGARTVLLAAETEVHETARSGGWVVQHRHAMYSGVTQRTLSAVLAPAGIRYDGLTAPLRQFQVQRLLGARYADLAHLQHSCWSQTAEERACSACGECRGIALNLLADGVAPEAAGIDLATLLVAQEAWRPRLHEVGSPLPTSRWAFDAQALRCVEAVPPERMREVLAAQGAPPERQAAAREAYERLHRAALEVAREPEPGYRAGFLALQPPERRAGLEAIFDEHFPREPVAEHEAVIARGLLLSDWITAPLRAPAAPAAVATPADAGRPVRPRPPSPAPPTPEELAPVAHLIPDPEPDLVAPPDAPVLRVAETLLDGNERRYVEECLATNWISSAGSFVGRFEAAFAEACGTRFGIACSSGTTALHLAVAAAGIGPGDEVIVPALTMIASANAVDYVGGRAVLVDTDAGTWNLDLEQVQQRIGPRTRAIMPVHTYGQPADMDELRGLADDNGLVVIEDAAEAHGAEVDGRRVGGLGDVAAFSFYGNKILTTGEGGMVTTNDPGIAAIARELRDHAFSPDRHFWHRFRAFNYRMGNLQAAVGLAQVERLDELVAAHRRVAADYAEALAGIPGLTLPPHHPGRESVHWVHGIVVEPAFGCSRDHLRRHLAARGIETRTFFLPLHLQPAYRLEHPGRRHPVAERLGASGLYLPSSPALSRADVERVAAAIRAAAAGVA